MATLSEIARHAGVSVSVVSRVLTGDPTLRTRNETRQRVLQVAKDLNYTANYAGRALRLARSKALALITPGVSSPLFDDLLSGATDAAEEEDYTLLIGRSDRITQGSDTLRRLAGEGRVDGFVLQRSDDLSDQALESLVANDARFVLVTSRTPGRRGSVILDDVAGARLATEHLIALGHTRIALVGGIPSSDIARRREQGYALALHEAGLRRRENLVRRLGYSPEMAAAAIESLVAGVPRPTGVVVANVNGAIGALTALRRLGVDVPERHVRRGLPRRVGGGAHVASPDHGENALLRGRRPGRPLAGRPAEREPRGRTSSSGTLRHGLSCALRRGLRPAARSR